MAKLTDPLLHAAMRRLWLRAGNRYCGLDTAILTNTVSASKLVDLFYAKLVEGRGGFCFFTESGLAYCREHFGKEAQNA